MASQLPQQGQPLTKEGQHISREYYLYFAGLQSSAGPAIPFRSLPPNPQIGQLAVINDSSTSTWGATIASTSPAPGATVLAWFNSAGNWSVIGS